MIHFLYKLRHFSTLNNSFQKFEVQRYLDYILNNPKELYIPYIQKNVTDTRNLVMILQKLNFHKKWDQIGTLLPLITKANCPREKYFTGIFSFAKSVKIPQEHLEILLEIIRENKELTPRNISEIIRSLPSIDLKTIEKFEILEILSEKILKNFEYFNTYDRAYVLEGLLKYPCSENFEIFKRIATDDPEAMSLKELSALCNYLSFHRHEEYIFLFDIFEAEILKDNPDNKLVVYQAIHSFAKTGKGSQTLIKYFLKLAETLQYSVDNETIGMIVSNLIKFDYQDPADIERIKTLYQINKKRFSHKHNAMVKFYLNQKNCS